LFASVIFRFRGRGSILYHPGDIHVVLTFCLSRLLNFQGSPRPQGGCRQ